MCLHMRMWFIIHACRGGGKSQQEADQTYDHKTSPMHNSSLLWDPVCPIKKLLLADASSALFYGRAPGAKDRHVFSCTGKRVWRWRLRLYPSTGLPEKFWSFNEQFVKAKSVCTLTSLMITYIKKNDRMFFLLSAPVFARVAYAIFSSTLSLDVLKILSNMSVFLI